jgi:hypothetical protein
MNHAWGDSWGDAWGDSWGIGLAEESGIGLAPVAKPVDFVYSEGWSTVPQNRKVVNLQIRRTAKHESELREMVELYSRWKKAA